MKMKYPIYIISKGRWESRLTSKALEEMDIPYYIVVEPQEYEKYANVIEEKKILVLPFSNLGQGSIPVRNWVWKDSIKRGFKRHWIIDDNIKCFRIYNRNKRIKVNSANIFVAAEDFVDRYENIGMAGFQYTFFCPDDGSRDYPYMLNTRIYSCILIKNDLPHRWRGKYNEDTDLSLRILKDGHCTLLFYSFLCDKKASMTMKGGNTDNVYNDGSNRLKFTQSLCKQHPDIVKSTWKFNRWHHQVDYRQFKKNKLIRKKGLMIPNKINNYGLELIKINNTTNKEDKNEY
ncbi:hypothetical protein CMI37_01995 [Candidatus Pacearchaeota archaeon]|nr:hypothetical protein [Candidatus Pacearchaeota archaeon]